MKHFGEILKNAIACIGVIGGIIGFLNTNNRPSINTLGFKLIVLIVFVVSLHRVFIFWRKRSRTILGRINFPDYIIRQASPDDLEAIAELQKISYHEDAVPISRYRQWFEASPDGFFVIEAETEARRELVGHITFLSIKEERLELYKEGDILETEIQGCDLIPTGRNSKADHIYLESIIIKPNHRRHAWPHLIRLARSMIVSICDTKRVSRIYAMAATGDGLDLITNKNRNKDNNFGFSILPPKQRPERKDKHSMYACSFHDFFKLIQKKEEAFELKLLRTKSSLKNPR